MIIGKRRQRVKQLDIGTPLRSGKRALRAQLLQVTTLVLDTSSLITDSYKFVSARSIHATQDEIITVAHNALSTTLNSKLLKLSATLPVTKNAAGPPIGGGKRSITWSTWHHGGDYMTFWFGSVTAVLHHADITDTERETIMLDARKAISRGLIAYAVGSCLTHTAPARPDHNIVDIGLIFVKPILHRGTETALKQVKARGIDIVIVSAEDTYTTTAVACVAGLTERGNIAVTLTAERINSMHSALFSGCTPALRRQLVASYPAGTVAIASVPLPEFWLEFTAALQ